MLYIWTYKALIFAKSDNFPANLDTEGRVNGRPELFKDAAEKVTDFKATGNDVSLFYLDTYRPQN